MSLSKKTLVLGASDNPSRYAYIAANRLHDNGHEIVLVGNRDARVAGEPIHRDRVEAENIDTVTLYLNPRRQEQYYDYILSLKPKRVIFNPGTENQQLMQLLEENGIAYEAACTLVLLGQGQY